MDGGLILVSIGVGRWVGTHEEGAVSHKAEGEGDARDGEGEAVLHSYKQLRVFGAEKEAKAAAAVTTVGWIHEAEREPTVAMVVEVATATHDTVKTI